ncbi:RNA polymerase III-inhibiting protein maf1 [Collariella sp. IMI 366227]|nr:RNA polymerase III-inhibiting protein maf1 [Collariella sp. IMI 366227]
MKYLSLPAFDVVTSALNFDTPDCHITGSCDLYTTKAAGSDKKLYKNIQQSLESQHAALLKLGASLSPPQRTSMAASLNLSRSSPFGSLDQVSNRRTYAYLIATLNASHPDYDFSHVLRPADFQRERLLRRVMGTIDSTLSSVMASDDEMDDGLVWNRDADGDVNCQYGDGGEDYEEEEAMETDEEEEQQQPGRWMDKGKDARRRSESPVRGVSEDIAASMEIDV